MVLSVKRAASIEISEEMSTFLYRLLMLDHFYIAASLTSLVALRKGVPVRAEARLRAAITPHITFPSDTRRRGAALTDDLGC